jgi:class 3 adenylate cyclase
MSEEQPTPKPSGSTTRVHLDEVRGAWLETAGEKFPIVRNCSIGRGPKNTIVLESPKVSRRHAIINVQNIGEFWLIDLGSSNGTFVNHRRLQQPIRLSDQDQVVIGDRIFIFHQPDEITDEYRTTYASSTIREIANVPCWLVVADIENFTPLSRSLTSDQLAVLFGGWVAACKEIIEGNEGTIDKYLGDGFLAYWRDRSGATKNVAATINQIKELQKRNEPPFRVACHFGFVAIGGMPSMGEESLMGKEVNFVFRMEKLAGQLNVYRLLSDAAKVKLGKLVTPEGLGGHEVKGFEGSYEFCTC